MNTSAASTAGRLRCVGRLRPKAVSRHGHDPRHSSERLRPRVFRHSLVYRTFYFALQRDSLSFACPNERKQRKRHPARRRLTPVHSDARADGMRAELGSLWRSSNMLRAPARCAGHPSPLSVSVAVQRDPIQTSGLNLQRATASSPVLGSLGAAPSSADRERKKTAGCLSVSEFPAVPLAGRDGKEPMRSIGARQGVFCFGYFHLDKQMKVTRTAVRNPNPRSIRAVNPRTLRAQTTHPSTRDARSKRPLSEASLHACMAPRTHGTVLNRGRP